MSLEENVFVQKDIEKKNAQPKEFKIEEINVVDVNLVNFDILNDVSNEIDKLNSGIFKNFYQTISSFVLAFVSPQYDIEYKVTSTLKLIIYCKDIDPDLINTTTPEINFKVQLNYIIYTVDEVSYLHINKFKNVLTLDVQLDGPAEENYFIVIYYNVINTTNVDWEVPIDLAQNITTLLEMNNPKIDIIT
ncbi:cyun22 [Cyclophragma undans nucleopolyhedrovirus]|uniref:Cyun22 n=1 Tax=Cyclophragma undans nucleopolyhedrovirus TaxID=1906244 RepID=A0A288QZH3_9ABAC|nr:cyun22 [Cyclophragma undans nucleopolyhedrovirus]AOT85492.1 cyun22 [Cyclophragma undans nucleopolyhedrovirus]